MPDAAIDAFSPPVPPSTRRAARGIFFPASAALLLALVLVGFARTFYLRPWFDDTPLALSLQLHGIALTAWFALFLVQALLVRRGGIALHRRLGVLGAVIVAAVVPSSLVVLFDIVHAWRAAGMDVDAQRQLLSMIVWGNLGAVLAFTLFFVRGVLKRRVADAHKRLMLLASISIISPAVSRIMLLPALGLQDPIMATVLGSVVLVLVLAVFDLVSRRRLHRETLWGVPFYLFAQFGPVFLLPGTAADAWLMARLW